MPTFSVNHLVTVIRDRGTASEKKWDARMGGDLDGKALFYLADRVKTGDEIEGEVFDEPRIVF